MPDLETRSHAVQLKNIPPDRFQPKVIIIWLAMRRRSLRPVLVARDHGSPAPLKIHEVVQKAEAQEIKTG